MRENFDQDVIEEVDLQIDGTSPTKSMLYFFFISILYLILNIYNINSATSIENVIENSNSNIYIIVYILILVIGMFFINLGISKQLCEGNNNDNMRVFFSTFLPWIIIFGVLYFILEIFSGWVRPFSNTIGYTVVQFLGIESILNKMLKRDNDTVKEAIEKIDTNKTEFINEFDNTHTEYTNFIKKLQAENITKSSALNFNSVSEDEIELFKLINIKHIIGKVVWYILAGTLIASISYNNIVTMQCEPSLKKIQEEIDKIQE